MTNNHFKSILKDEAAIYRVAKLFGCHDKQVAYILQKFAWLPESVKDRIFSMMNGDNESNATHEDLLAIHDVAADFHLNDDEVIKIMCAFSRLPLRVQDQICSMTCQPITCFAE